MINLWKGEVYNETISFQVSDADVGMYSLKEVRFRNISLILFQV